MRLGFRQYILEEAHPQKFQETLEHALTPLGYSLQKPGALADAIVRLSDHYNQPQSRLSPWEQTWAQAAYYAYFLPLNWIRLQAVFSQGQALGFFKDIQHVWDLGAGPLTAWLAWTGLDLPTLPWLAIEPARAAQQMGSLLQTHLRAGRPTVQWASSAPLRGAPSCLGIFSYVVNELPSLPQWANECEALLFIEPSTQTHGRALQSLRGQLLAQGWYAWAPCTHQAACPLLIQSERDWCHDRVEFTAPRWFTELETHLPMKNRTLTYSYLLVRRTPPPDGLTGLARLVGDQLNEKGKTRQLICQGQDRQFLSWMHRNGTPPEFSRGALVRLKGTFEKKGQELRSQHDSVELIENFQVFNRP